MNSSRRITTTMWLLGFVISPLASGQTQIAKFAAPISAINQGFGLSVATDGKLVLVGTQWAASAFLYNPFTRQQLANFEVPGFQTSVALEGTTAVIGTWQGAQIFDFSDLSNIVRTALVPNDGAEYQFGYSVDISGDTVIVGAPSDGPAGFTNGAAYLFDRKTGSQIAKLSANDAEEYDNVGISVAVDGGLAVVGSYNADSNHGQDRGAVYLFNAQPDFIGDRQLAKYTAPSLLSGAHFGVNTDIAGERVISRVMTGYSFLWRTDEQPIMIPDSSSFESHWDSLSISKNWAAVGRPNLNRATVYNLDGSIFGAVLSPDSQQAAFGTSVAVGGNLLVVGSPGPANIGGAYVYLLPEPVVPEPTGGVLSVICISLILCSRPHRHLRAAVAI